MVESNYPAEMRKVIFDSAMRIGTGVLKGPIPTMKKNKAAKEGSGRHCHRDHREGAAAATNGWMSGTSFLTGLAGEDIHDGDFVFERDFMSPRKLKSLKRQTGIDGTPVYLAEQIDKVLEEGPGKVQHRRHEPEREKNDKRFEIWYFTGTLSRKDMEAANAVGIEDLPMIWSRRTPSSRW